MLLLLLIAPLTLTTYADSGQKVIKLKVYIVFSFRRDTLKWPFGPFCLKERHGVYVPTKYFILRPVRDALSMLDERVFVSKKVVTSINIYDFPMEIDNYFYRLLSILLIDNNQ